MLLLFQPRGFPSLPRLFTGRPGRPCGLRGGVDGNLRLCEELIDLRKRWGKPWGKHGETMEPTVWKNFMRFEEGSDFDFSWL